MKECHIWILKYVRAQYIVCQTKIIARLQGHSLARARTLDLRNRRGYSGEADRPAASEIPLSGGSAENFTFPYYSGI